MWERLSITLPLNSVSNEFLLSLPIIEHNGVQFRKWVKDERYRYRYTGCQCFKSDCGCPEMNGEERGAIRTYYRKVEFDNTNKAFYDDLDYVPYRLR
jgi:hypothetical protein